MVDRSEASRALAKAIAYKQCGKDDEARQWARKLVTLLECAEILADEHICVCGRSFGTSQGRTVHMRACSVERARSAAFVEAVQAGKDAAGVAEAAAAAVRTARAQLAEE